MNIPNPMLPIRFVVVLTFFVVMYTKASVREAYWNYRLRRALRKS